MAYKKDEIYQEAIKATKLGDMYFISDIIDFLPISKPTFYEFFPPESNELNNLKKNLYGNKLKTKLKLRKQLGKGEKAAEIIALYKLVCSDTERRALSQSYHDHTTKGEGIKPQQTFTPEQIDKIIDKL